MLYSWLVSRLVRAPVAVSSGTEVVVTHSRAVCASPFRDLLHLTGSGQSLGPRIDSSRGCCFPPPPLLPRSTSLLVNASNFLPRYGMLSRDLMSADASADGPRNADDDDDAAVLGPRRVSRVLPRLTDAAIASMSDSERVRAELHELLKQYAELRWMWTGCTWRHLRWSVPFTAGGCCFPRGVRFVRFEHSHVLRTVQELEFENMTLKFAAIERVSMLSFHTSGIPFR